MGKKKRTSKSKSSDKTELLPGQEWRNKPVKSKYALKNLPPTTDPQELKRREKMKKWEEVNQKLVDSWLDYIVASDTSDVFSNIVVKKTPGFQEDEVYDDVTLKPIPSEKYPGKTMKFGEWSELWEKEQRRNRTRTGNFIRDLLEGLAHSMMP